MEVQKNLLDMREPMRFDEAWITFTISLWYFGSLKVLVGRTFSESEIKWNEIQWNLLGFILCFKDKQKSHWYGMTVGRVENDNLNS